MQCSVKTKYWKTATLVAVFQQERNCFYVPEDCEDLIPTFAALLWS